MRARSAATSPTPPTRAMRPSTDQIMDSIVMAHPFEVVSSIVARADASVKAQPRQVPRAPAGG